MAIGPVEYIVIEFPGNQFRGEIMPVLRDLVAKRTIHVIDGILIRKDAQGTVQWFELDQPGDNAAKSFDELEGEILGLVNAEDVALVAKGLAPNSSAALLVWEDSWATQLATAVRNAQGRVVAYERIPHEVVETALAAGPQISAQA
jgi:hypothetical protein